MPKRNELVGQRFGKKLVIDFYGTDKRGRRTWVARCDCGAEMVTTTQLLKNEDSGCRQCAHKGLRPWRRKRPYEAIYNALVKRGRHPVLITYEQFVVFAKIKNCHYCGAFLMWNKHRVKGKGAPSNLDRKDNLLPYVFDNLVVCCTRCNKAKNTHFTYDEWKILGNVVRQWGTRLPPKRD